MRRNRLNIVWIAAWVLVCNAPRAWAVCTGPATLEAKVHGHPDADSYAELGAWFGERSQFGCSLETLRTGLKLDPDSAKLNYLLGLTLLSSERADQAIEPIERAIRQEPKALEPHILLATAYVQLQKTDEAKTEWQAVLGIDPGSAVALDGLSKILISKGDFQGAVKLLTPAKRNEDLELDLALAYAKADLLDQSAAVLEKAAQADPSSARIADALAIVYVKQRRMEDASTLLKKSLELHPKDANGEHIYLRTLVLSGDMTTARPLGVKLLAADPHSFDLLYLNGAIENQLNLYPAARDHLKEAAELNPDDSSVHFHLGIALMHLKDSAGARAQFEKAVALDPANPEAHFQLATALRGVGETQAAQEQLKLYQQALHAKSERALADSKAGEAEDKMTAGDFKQAAALLKEAADAVPDDAEIEFKLALALDKAGDPDGERAALEKAVKADPGMAPAQNQLGYLISRNGDPTGAEEHFRLAVKAAPGYTDAWINLAAALGMQSRYPEAQQALAQALELEPSNPQALGLKNDLTAAQPHP